MTSLDEGYVTLSKQQEKLINILKANNLHDDLFKIFDEKDIDLSTLECIGSGEADQFCDAFQITSFKTKLSIRKLLKCIENNKENVTEIKQDNINENILSDRNDDEQLKQFLIQNKISLDLYAIFISQDIGYDELATITPYDIDNLCNKNNITIGIKIKLKNVIDEHQMQLIEESEPTLKQKKLDIDVEEKKMDNNAHLCICSNPLTQILDGTKLYDQRGVLCDSCAKAAKKHDIFWHCNKGHTPDHKQGFDICNKCITKYKHIPIKAKKPDYKMKIILVGDAAVGKTSLITKYINDEFRDEIDSTIGVAVFRKQQLLSNGKIAELQIWDTAGQERFSPLTRGHYRDADAILLCYGCDNKRTFNNLDRYWKEQIEENAKDDIIMLIIGCKSDRKNERQLTENEAKKIINLPHWKRYNAWWCECSAKKGSNVRSAFTTAAELVVKQQNAQAESLNAYQPPIQFQQRRPAHRRRMEMNVNLQQRVRQNEDQLQGQGCAC